MDEEKMAVYRDLRYLTHDIDGLRGSVRDVEENLDRLASRLAETLRELVRLWGE